MSCPIAKLHTRFAEAVVDEEIVIMRLDNGELLSLIDSGAAIWRLIDGKRDRAALLAALADDYQTRESGMAADVDAFLDQLRKAGLVADV